MSDAQLAAMPSPTPEDLTATGLTHHQSGDLDAAETLYRQALRLDSRHADALHLLGVLSQQRGDHGLAVELIREAIERNPAVPAFHNNLGNALRSQLELDAAARAYRQALALLPAYPDAHYNLGLTLQSQGKASEAAESYRRALRHRPAHPDALNNLGNILQAGGQLEEAVAAYSQALSYRPNDPDAHNNLGAAHIAQGHWQEAVAACTRALTLQPDCAAAYNNLGIALTKQHRHDEAIGAFARALTHEPHYPEAMTHLGTALLEQGRQPEAQALYRHALQLKPDYAEAALALAVASIPDLPETAADSARAVESFEGALDELQAWDREHPGVLGRAAGSVQPFQLAYRPLDLTATLTRYGRSIGAAAADYWRSRAVAAVEGPRRGRVRLLIVSAHVRAGHPVWEIVLRGLLAHLDRGKFEVIVYQTQPQAGPAMDWARSRVDRLVRGTLPTPVWLEHVARDRPDVIYYPEIGMDAATAALAAMRLAPLQIAGWGHPVTTGLPSIDWFMSAELLEGEGAEQHYSEKLIKLPGTGVCTELQPLRVEPWPEPPRDTNVVRFVLCHQPNKLDPADDELLVRIARAAAPCELWLSTPPRRSWMTDRLRHRLAAAFRHAGLDPDSCIRVTPWLPPERFAAYLDAMDIYLDSPGFSGYTTAWHAAHRGLPIVTLQGRFLRQRLAAGLLLSMGRHEGIATTRDEYVEIATGWARELRRPGRMSEWRHAIQQAAQRADGNPAPVAAFERAVLEHFEPARVAAHSRQNY